MANLPILSSGQIPLSPATTDQTWFTKVAEFFADPNVSGMTTFLGTLASLVGLALTLWVLYSVRSIRAHFMFAARGSQIIEAIQANTSAISKGINEFEASAEIIDVEFAKCHANLKNLKAKVRNPTRKTIALVIKKIETYLGGAKEKSFAREIYTSLNGLLQELHNLQQDLKWSDTDAG